jgi:hypothetical protein
MAFKETPPVKEIRVGAKFYSLVRNEALVEDGETLHGLIDYEGLKISINPNGDTTGTALHEPIHALRHHMGLRDEIEKVEEFITTLTENTVRAFIADNLELCRWIIDQVEKEVHGKPRKTRRKAR